QKILLSSPDMSPAGLPLALRQQIMLIRSAAEADLGEPRTALRTIEQARALDPQMPGAWLAEVPVRLRLGQYAEASAAVDKAVSLAPESADTHYLRGSVVHAAGKASQAVESYGKALAIDPNHLGALIARAGLLIDLNRFADARKDLDSIQKINPEHPLGIYLRALVAERDGKVKEAQTALRELTELLDRIPLDYIRYKPQVLMLNGLAHFGLNEPEKAKQYFEIYLKAQGDSPIAKPLAQIYLRTRNYDQAITTLEIYLRARPNDVQALTLLGSALMANGQYARASRLMEQAIASRDDPRLHAVLGMSMLSSGQTSKAMVELEKAVKADPGQIAAATTLITYYQRNAQFSKAIALAETLVKRNEKNPGLSNLLGMVKANSGNAAGARQAFDKALALQPKFVLPKLNLARLDIRAGQYPQAEQRLKDVLTAEPKNSEAMFEFANLETRRGRIPATREWLDKAVASSGPRETRWGLALADFHLAHGNTKLALKAAKDMATKTPDDLPVVMMLAKAHLAAGDVASAKTQLTLATRLADFNPQAQTQVAELQLAANNLEGAAYSIDKALSGQATYVPALALQARLDIRRGNKSAADKRVRDLIAKHPKSVVGHWLQADLAAANGQSTEAVAAYRRAYAVSPSTESFLRAFNAMSFVQAQGTTDFAQQWLKQHPGDVLARTALGNHFSRAGNLAAAKTEYQQALKLAPEQPEVLNNLANVLIHLKDPQAVAVAEQAVRANPDNGLVVDTLGWALASSGQSDKALATLRQARNLEPEHPEIHYHLGVVLAQLGQKPEARDQLNTALKLNPQLRQAAHARELLDNLR
ncbi:MAG: hypothetical protein RLZZ126_662, partial [Pseudomonadota bacterium]